jgi:hypothetical protein
MDDDLYLLPADLNNEDDDGLGWTIVELPDFQPGRVFPGALLRAGRPGAETLVAVVRTELFETTAGRTVVLVSFRKELAPGDRERYAW